MKYLTKGTDYLALHPGFKLVDRKTELARLKSVLLRRSASSVILAGPGGVGCTALVLGLQLAKARPDASFDITDKRLFWLDVSGLLSEADGAQLDVAFHRILDRMRSDRGAILAVEDGRGLIDGLRSAAPHLINALMSGVRSRSFQLLLECLDDDLETVLRSHSDMRQLFTIVAIEEPTGNELLEIVSEAAQGTAAYHGIAVSPGAITAAIELTTKYHPPDPGLSRAQPERSLTLLDRALSAYRLVAHQDLDSAPITKLIANRRDHENFIGELQDRIDEHRQPSPDNARTPIFSGGLDTPEMVDWRRQIAAAKADLVAIDQELEGKRSAVNAGLMLSRDSVLTEFADISGIPVSKLNENDVEKLRNLEATLGKRVYGQEEVIRRLANGVKIARVGRRNNNKPLASYLFLGPSGVGKTELSKALAAAMLDDEAALTRFDMSEYMEKHAVAKLIGAPPGYEGFEAGGILTNLMRRSGNRVLLFDEIEKAHPDIFNIMLQVLEDGRLTDNVGRTASFADAVIIMTTNIGQPHFLDPELSVEEAEARAMEDLGATYRSEFLNRFAGRQNIICFKKLGLDSIEKIVWREIAGLDATYGEKGIRVVIADADLVAFCEDQYDPKIGARGLPGFIAANLEPMIVNRILADPNVSGTATIRYDRASARFTVEL